MRDTLYFESGEIHSILDFDTCCFMRYNGYFSQYDTLGNLTEEGTYKYVDSIECFECYEDEELTPVQYIYDISIKTGEWKYYYKNGNLKRKGMYAEKVRIILYSYEQHDHFNLDIVELENGYWEYYNKEGELSKKILFKDGLKIEQKKY